MLIRLDCVIFTSSGTRKGRGGLGSIYVFASGNGGRVDDHCGCDGFVNMPETIAIGGIDYCGQIPFYAERCPGMMAVTYSSGSNINKRITTIDLNGKCTNDFTGTSAAAPIASGEFFICIFNESYRIHPRFPGLFSCLSDVC